MNYKVAGALLAMAAGAGLLIFRQPTLDETVARLEPELSARLDAREVQIDPSELLEIIYNNNVGLRIIDVREEADFNIFHIVDSRRATLEQIRDPEWVKKLPSETVIVVVSNDEKKATEAWKLLAAQKVLNLYILEGGINLWLQVYREGNIDALPEPDGNDKLRHEFTAALGWRHPASDPDPQHAPKRSYTKKVKDIGGAARKTGGCG